MHTFMAYQRMLSWSMARRGLQLAQDYLILPDRIHRWCVAGVAGMIALLVGCFVNYAYSEKYHLTENFFYGRLEFSFVDGGYPEMFGYALEITACMLFFSFAMGYGKKHWYAWSAILFVAFVDDAFKLHETIGNAFTQGMHLGPAVGDLIGFATTGLLSAVLWIAGMRTITDDEDLSAYLVFTMYFALLIFFGVGVDAVHELLGAHVSQTVFTIFEDGGELLMTAVIALSVYGMWLRHKHVAMAQDEVMVSVLSKP